MHHQSHARSNATETGRTPARTTAAPGGTSLQRLQELQRSAGNAAVVQLLRKNGHTGKQEEREEHRHGAGCGHGESVQRSAVHDVLRSAGRPMDDSTRTDMESRLGADFSDVRIHDNAAAKASAAEVGARAYTSGSHVVIGDGGGDKHTLAHELTHVIQQRQGPVAGTDNGSGLKVSDPSDRFEREAEANATRVMQRSADPGARSEATADSRAPMAAAPTSIQRFGIADGGDLGDVRASENSLYLIKGADEGQGDPRIWVRQDAAAPRQCVATGATVELAGFTYAEWRPSGQFFADCLHSAEEIMAGQQFALGDGIHSEAAGTGAAFGQSRTANIKAAKGYAGARGDAGTDHDEAPGPGQAFAIVETKYAKGVAANKSGFPYHAAAAVAKDGNDVITLEAWASDVDAQLRDQDAEFSMYEAGNKQLSFFAVHSPNFSGGAIAITLNPR